MVVLVGFGQQMLSEYLPSLRQLGIKITAVCEPDTVRAGTAMDQELTTFPLVSDLPNHLCHGPALVAVPHFVTASAISSLLYKGFKKILIEKPPALNMEDFSATNERISAIGARVYVAAKRRYFRAYIELKSGLNCAEAVGSVHIRLHRSFQEKSFGWRSDPAKAGPSVMFDLGYHAIDLALWLADFPTNLVASSDSSCFGVDNLSTMRRTCLKLRFSDRAFDAYVDVDRVAPSPFEQIVVDYADKQIFAQPNAVWSVRKRNDYMSEEILAPVDIGSTTNAMLVDFFKNETLGLSEYADHFGHMAAIDRVLQLKKLHFRGGK